MSPRRPVLYIIVLAVLMGAGYLHEHFDEVASAARDTIAGTVLVEPAGTERPAAAPEGNIQLLSHFPAYQFTCCCDFICGLLYFICKFIKTGFLRQRLYRSTNHTWPRNTNVQRTFRLTYSMKCTCHKRIITGSITKTYKLCSTYPIGICCQFCRLFNNLPHFIYRIHVYAGFRRSKIHR